MSRTVYPSAPYRRASLRREMIWGAVPQQLHDRAFQNRLPVADFDELRGLAQLAEQSLCLWLFAGATGTACGHQCVKAQRDEPAPRRLHARRRFALLYSTPATVAERASEPRVATFGPVS